ncbi:MAG: hypothetical protein IT338_16695 [Thermomicrobiales bacterium]|nr:hypothetical protein [Thermomicrobiales bacterium]
MRYVPFLTAILAAAAALVLGSAPHRTGAQTDAPSATDSAFVGAWRLTFDTPTGPSQSLLTVMGDGTVLFSGRPVSPAAGENPITFSSAGHGAWQPTGPATAATTWIGLVTDGEGNFLAIVTDSVEATLGDDGNSWHGNYSATVADPDGNVMYVGGATVRATRITVQPLATPVPGTPTT